MNKAYGISGNHGFQSGCGTDKSGNVPVYIYAINKGAGENVLLGTQTINISKDKVKPTITNVKVSNISATGYRVSCTVKDNNGVARVEFPTWTHANGQSDDIIWHKGVKSGDNYYYDVKVSEHKGETGFYSTHIYAYDAAGNEAKAFDASNIFVPAAMASYGNSVYYLSDAHYTWKEAQEYCANAYGSGHLATISDADEQNTVKGLLKSGSSTYYYIGASDAAKEGTWKWLGDEDLSAYSNWASGEPNGGTSENYAAILKSDGKWNDLNGKSRTDTGLIMEVDLNREIAGEVVTDFPEGTYTINSFKDASYSIDIEAGSTKECANVQIYKANGTEAQKFKFSKNDDGTYTIANVKSGMVLDVEAGSWKDLTNVWQYRKNGTAAQKWYVEKGSGDFYYLRCKKNNLYLDVHGGTMANGTNVDAYHANYTAAQKFVLTKADKPKVLSRSISDVTPEGYTVSLTIDTMEGWDHIEFPTWTQAGDKDGQDDITWEKGTVNGNVVTYQAKASKHNGDRGLYNTHVYVLDKYGNSQWLASFDNILVPAAIESHGSSTYYLTDEAMSWSDAQKLGAKQAFANGRKSHLAAINGAEEQAVVASLAKQGRQTYYFIGASDADDEGAWKWTTGGSLDAYSNWESGEPNGGADENYAALIRTTGQWNDLAGTKRADAGFIYEVEGDDRVGPEVSDVNLDSMSEDGFSVSLKVADPSGIGSVRFAVWPDSGSEANAVWADATSDGLTDAQIYDDGMAYLQVKASDHGNATGAYHVKVQATDGAGNESVSDITDKAKAAVPDAVYASESSLYYRFDQPMSWTGAREWVDSLGFENLKLASLTTEADADAMAPLLAGAGKTAYWVGLADEDGTGDFAWADGSAKAPGNWASGQPAKSDGPAYAALFASNQKLYALANAGVGTNSSEMGFIAEVSFGEDDEPAADTCDEHAWGEWTATQEPTCTAPGYRQRVCEVCGDIEAEELVALEHEAAEPVREAEVDPTCEAEGSYDLVTYCSRCNEVLDSEAVTVPAVDHAWSDWTPAVPATCEEGGTERRVCSYDDAHVEERATEALGHEAAEPVRENEVAPTCEEAGSYDAVTYCARCGAELSRETVAVPAAGHDWGAWETVSGAMCGTPGVEKRVCKSDGTHVEKRETEALGHSYVATVVEPTEDSDGYTVHVCSRCGDAYIDGRVDSLSKQANRAAAQEAQAAIGALPAAGDLTLDDAEAVADARAAYEALTDAQKALVEGAEAIAAAEKRLVELADERKAAEDRAAADAAIAAIKAIPSVASLSKDDAEGIAAAKAAVAVAHKAYDGLTAEQLDLVENANYLFAAEQVLAGLEEQAVEDVFAADEVDGLIAKISTKGLDASDAEGIAAARKAVDAARAAYDALTPDQRALVQNAETLFASEVAVSRLEQKAQQAADAGQAAVADEAIAQVPAPGSLTGSEDDRATVAAARAAYEALTAGQKRLVEGYDALLAAEQRLVEIAREDAGRAEEQAAVAPVADAIAKLPGADAVGLGDVSAIAAARAAYDALSDEQRALVDGNALVQAEEALAAAQKAAFEEAVSGASIVGADSVEAGATADLAVSGRAAAAGSWTWSSSDEAVAAVDGFGTVTGVAEGRAVIEAVGACRVYGSETLLWATLSKDIEVVAKAEPAGPRSIAGAEVTGIAGKTYTGRAITQKPVVKLDGKALAEGTDYTVSYKNNVKAGTATVTIEGAGAYTGSVSKTFAIAKAKNGMKVKGSTKKVSAKKLKKAKQAVKAAVKVTGAVGKVTYKKASGKAAFKVAKKTGKITVKKGTKKGTYKLKVTVTAKGDANHKPAKKTVTVKVRVR